MIKDKQGRDHLVLSDEDFYNDDIMGEKFEDYEILQVLTPKQKEAFGFVAKVRSKFNSKIYAMKKIDAKYASKESVDNIRKEFEYLKSMNHPNVTKYFKFFIEDQCLYIIYEYADNADINGLVGAYKSINKPIDVNTLWNIFMQSISALNYIHSQNIVHRNINLNNLLMTENKTIKLGDFRFSFLANNPNFNRVRTFQAPEMSNNIHYDQKTDVYALGVVFHFLCYFQYPNRQGFKLNKDVYPREMENIINLMISDVNQRPDAQNLFNLVMSEYIKNVAKVTSIDSVFRCMYSFMNFTQIMNQNAQSFLNVGKTPVSFNYVNCLQRYFSGENQKENAIFLNNFRNLLYKNAQTNNEIEVKPALVLGYLLEKLNKETGSNFSGPSLGIQPINFNTDKNKALNEFMAYYNNNFKSLISKFFVGFLKTKRICKVCREGLYSFNLFPYIEFDLDRCQNANNLNLQNWFKIQNNFCLILNKDHHVACQNCKSITEHNEFKQFFCLPHNFIISFNRGEAFKNQVNVNFPPFLDLAGNIEKGDSFMKFNLVGIIRRLIDEKGSEYYISIYFDPFQKYWFLCDRNNLSKIQNPLNYNNGMVMMLFYSAAASIGF